MSFARTHNPNRNKRTNHLHRFDRHRQSQFQYRSQFQYTPDLPDISVLRFFPDILRPSIEHSSEQVEIAFQFIYQLVNQHISPNIDDSRLTTNEIPSIAVTDNTSFQTDLNAPDFNYNASATRSFTSHDTQLDPSTSLSRSQLISPISSPLHLNVDTANLNNDTSDTQHLTPMKTTSQSSPTNFRLTQPQHQQHSSTTTPTTTTTTTTTTTSSLSSSSPSNNTSNTRVNFAKDIAFDPSELEDAKLLANQYYGVITNVNNNNNDLTMSTTGSLSIWGSVLYSDEPLDGIARRSGRSGSGAGSGGDEVALSLAIPLSCTGSARSDLIPSIVTPHSSGGTPDKHLLIRGGDYAIECQSNNINNQTTSHLFLTTPHGINGELFSHLEDDDENYDNTPTTPSIMMVPSPHNNNTNNNDISYKQSTGGLHSNQTTSHRIPNTSQYLDNDISPRHSAEMSYMSSRLQHDNKNLTSQKPNSFTNKQLHSSSLNPHRSQQQEQQQDDNSVPSSFKPSSRHFNHNNSTSLLNHNDDNTILHAPENQHQLHHNAALLSKSTGSIFIPANSLHQHRDEQHYSKHISTSTSTTVDTTNNPSTTNIIMNSAHRDAQTNITTQTIQISTSISSDDSFDFIEDIDTIPADLASALSTSSASFHTLTPKGSSSSIFASSTDKQTALHSPKDSGSPELHSTTCDTSNTSSTPLKNVSSETTPVISKSDTEDDQDDDEDDDDDGAATVRPASPTPTPPPIELAHLTRSVAKQTYLFRVQLEQLMTEYVLPNAIIVFDIDDTLITSQYHSQLTTKYRTSINPILQTTDIDYDYRNLLNTRLSSYIRPQSFTDPQLPIIITEIKRTKPNVKFLCCTARSAPIADTTYNQLKHLGLDFSDKCPDLLHDGVYTSKFHHTCEYFVDRGIVYTNAHHKGVVLFDILQRGFFHKKKVYLPQRPSSKELLQNPEIIWDPRCAQYYRVVDVYDTNGQFIKSSSSNTPTTLQPDNTTNDTASSSSDIIDTQDNSSMQLWMLDDQYGVVQQINEIFSVPHTMIENLESFDVIKQNHIHYKQQLLNQHDKRTKTITTTTTTTTSITTTHAPTHSLSIPDPLELLFTPENVRFMNPHNKKKPFERYSLPLCFACQYLLYDTQDAQNFQSLLQANNLLTAEANGNTNNINTPAETQADLSTISNFSDITLSPLSFDHVKEIQLQAFLLYHAIIWAYNKTIGNGSEQHSQGSKIYVHDVTPQTNQILSELIESIELNFTVRKYYHYIYPHIRHFFLTHPNPNLSASTLSPSSQFISTSVQTTNIQTQTRTVHNQSINTTTSASNSNTLNNMIYSNDGFFHLSDQVAIQCLHHYFLQIPPPLLVSTPSLTSFHSITPTSRTPHSNSPATSTHHSHSQHSTPDHQSTRIITSQNNHRSHHNHNQRSKRSSSPQNRHTPHSSQFHPQDNHTRRNSQTSRHSTTTNNSTSNSTQNINNNTTHVHSNNHHNSNHPYRSRDTSHRGSVSSQHNSQHGSHTSNSRCVSQTSRHRNNNSTTSNSSPQKQSSYTAIGNDDVLQTNHQPRGSHQ